MKEVILWQCGQLLGSWHDENVFYRPEINPHHFSHAGAVMTLRLAEMFVIPNFRLDGAVGRTESALACRVFMGARGGRGVHKDTTF